MELYSLRHVEALNGIQLEFLSKNPKEKPVVDAWQNYINHLNNHVETEAWHVQSRELLSELLLQIAICLRYDDINKARIRSEAYVPKYFFNTENELNELRKSALQVFKGKHAVKIEIKQ